jgi:hypothetical protein
MAQESDFLVGEPGELRTDVEEQATFLGRKVNPPVDLYILAEVERELVGLALLDGSTLARFRHGADFFDNCMMDRIRRPAHAA